MDSVADKDYRQVTIWLHPLQWESLEKFAEDCGKSVDDLVTSIFRSVWCVPGGPLPHEIREWYDAAQK